MTLVRSGQCPNCGAPISFEVGSSISKVCDHCRFVVVRTDRDLTTLGKVAELVPTSPPFEVGDDILVEGRLARVAGRVQKDFGSGPWDELSIGFEDGSWAWVARAQGRWYITSAANAGGPLPTWEQASVVGSNGRFGVIPTNWTAVEAKGSRVVSAKGEFADPFAPNEQNRYVDLVGPDGEFATLDYPSDGSPPSLYTGRVLPASAVVLASAALGPGPSQKTETARLRCPTCGAQVEVYDPATERVACQFCGNIADYSSSTQDLAALHTVAQERLRNSLSIPLGRRGTLRGVDVIVIGAMRRQTEVEGTWYSWLEYLLYSPSGYFWLVEDNGHFTFVRDTNPAQLLVATSSAQYEGKSFKAFFANELEVVAVAGEFYWKVAVGERSVTRDFIAPPLVLSVEQTDSERIVSIGEYVEPKEIEKAFGDGLSLPSRRGVGAAQPGPPVGGPFVALVFGLVMLAFVSTFASKGRPERILVSQMPLVTASMPGTPIGGTVASGKGAEPGAESAPPNVTLSESFVVAKPRTNLGIQLAIAESNVSVATNCALINDVTGEVREFVVEAGHYRGYSGGESWSEGSLFQTEYLDRVEAGTYTLRVVTEWMPFSGDGAAPGTGFNLNPSITVIENTRSLFCGLVAFLLLLAPCLFALLRAYSHHTSRWQNSNLVPRSE
jgi:hypothetical protein